MGFSAISVDLSQHIGASYGVIGGFQAYQMQSQDFDCTPINRLSSENKLISSAVLISSCRYSIIANEGFTISFALADSADGVTFGDYSQIYTYTNPGSEDNATGTDGHEVNVSFLGNKQYISFRVSLSMTNSESDPELNTDFIEATTAIVLGGFSVIKG